MEGIAKSDTNTDLVSHTLPSGNMIAYLFEFWLRAYCDWPGITFVLENLNMRLRNRLEHVEIVCIRNFRSGEFIVEGSGLTPRGNRLFIKC